MPQRSEENLRRTANKAGPTLKLLVLPAGCKCSPHPWVGHPLGVGWMLEEEVFLGTILLS
jgi:hypothetical protein